MPGTGLETVATQCPCCGEPIELLIDCSEEEQRYIEDYEVCCHPINVHVIVAASGLPVVEVSTENDA
ncbi:MAG: CPXCG motif-containing cysteine-rich protein [bacterium]|nr:CPXCG motif-containing cysteine-rich protein [bacterium]